MKFTITSITEEGVKAREDNLKPRPDTLSYIPLSGIGNYKRAQMMADWQEAEANRKEYKIAKTEIIDMTIIEGDFDYRIGNQGISYPTELGDRMDGDIKDNQIINIKLL